MGHFCSPNVILQKIDDINNDISMESPKDIYYRRYCKLVSTFCYHLFFKWQPGSTPATLSPMLKLSDRVWLIAGLVTTLAAEGRLRF